MKKNTDQMAPEKSQARYHLKDPSLSKAGNAPNAASLNSTRINSANAAVKHERAMRFVNARKEG